MVISMTGYGRSKLMNNNFVITTEIKTINHRYSEINVRLPKELSFIEEQIKRKVATIIRRGKAEVVIMIENSTLHKEKLNFNWELFEQYLHTFTRIAERYSLPNNISVTDLLQIQELFDIQYENEPTDELLESILTSLDEAISNLYSMRKKEGYALLQDFNTRLRVIKNYTDKIVSHAPEMVSTYQNRLHNLIKEISDKSIDEQRILTEVAIYADRSAIDEELIRLQSHLKQFSEILDEEDTIGRKLDFLLQEMNREINTIGSKSNHLDISRNVIEIKSQIEKLREQVQNIE